MTQNKRDMMVERQLAIETLIKHGLVAIPADQYQALIVDAERYRAVSKGESVWGSAGGDPLRGDVLDHVVDEVIRGRNE